MQTQARGIFVVGLVLLWLGAPAASQPMREAVGVDVVCEAVRGDTLFTVARAARLGLEHVAAASGLPISLEIEEGTVLTLPTRRILPAAPPANGIVLNVPERGLYLFRGGRFRAFYGVAVGRLDFPTPRGRFRVIERIVNPTWFPPAWSADRRAVAPGPDNPLGDRWIGTSATRVGIHGTQSPMSIGMCISHGCIRMYPEDVRQLFERVSIGTPVRIEYETAKIGVDRRTGQVYLATFPDVYRLAPPHAQAQRLLRHAGLLGRLTPHELRARASATFRCVPLFGSDFTVRVDGRREALPFDPVVCGRTLWVPLALARALGVSVHFPTPGSITLSRGRCVRTLRIESGIPRLVADAADPFDASAAGEPSREHRVARRWSGRIVVPVDALMHPFAASYVWNVRGQSLEISTQRADAPDIDGFEAPHRL